MCKNVNLLSVLILSILLCSPSFSQVNPGSKEQQFRRGFYKELNLTKAQEDLIYKLRLDHQSKMIDLTSELKKKELEKNKIFLNDSIARDEMINITKDISDIKNKIELLRINHQMDIYDILDENQKSVWKDIQLRKNSPKERMKREMFGRIGNEYERRSRN